MLGQSVLPLNKILSSRRRRKVTVSLMLNVYDILNSYCVNFIWYKVILMDEIVGRNLHSLQRDYLIQCYDQSP